MAKPLSGGGAVGEAFIGIKMSRLDNGGEGLVPRRALPFVNIQRLGEKQMMHAQELISIWSYRGFEHNISLQPGTYGT